MAKRRRTTGLPKAKAPVPGVEISEGKKGIKRENLSHAEREAELQRMILWGTGAVLGIIILIIAIALIKSMLIDPARSVAIVNGEKISVKQYQDRVRLERLILIEQINARADEIIDLGYATDLNDALGQLYQFDPAFQAAWEELNLRDQMGLRVLNDMIDDILVRQEAERLNITVSQEEIDEQINTFFRFDAIEWTAPVPDAEATAETTPDPPTPTPTPFVSPTPTSTPTETPTPETTVEATLTPIPFPTIAPAPTRTFEERTATFEANLDAFYKAVRRETGMSREEADAYFETQALRVALSKVVIEPETTTVWVNARHILVNTEAEALDIIAALNAGESFARLANVASIDTGSGAQGGDLGWADTANYIPEFAEAVKTLPIGAISEPVQSTYGYHIIQVREREERDVADYLIESNRVEAFEEWVNDLRNREGNTYEIKDIWFDYVPSDPPYAPRGSY